MTHLRSPAVHHLDTNPFSLLRFAKHRRPAERGQFAPPYDRPSLELFRAHSDLVIERHGLAERHIRGRVASLATDGDGATARLDDGLVIRARQVILALGAGDAPHWPDWAPCGDERVRHVFERGRQGWPPPEHERVAVVGGGISAAQVALRLSRQGRQVELLSRHALRRNQFDSDPGWLGPKLSAGYARIRDPAARRTVLDEARHKGSVPPDVHRDLRRALNDGRIGWRPGGVAELEDLGTELRVHRTHGEPLDVDHVLLATGFASQRPGGRLVDELIASAGLSCAPCGYPIVDRALRWHPRLHVTGPLAELEVGPAARTIAGARIAADRILAS